MRCIECGREYPLEAISICKYCWGPLEVKYDYTIIKDVFSKEKLSKRAFNLWRYFEFLPLENKESTANLHDGGTPLQRCKRLGEIIGLKNLYVKNDTLNPTGSFKDRPASVGVSKCIEFGIDVVGCASTGNLAGAVAAHAAVAGLKCFILVPETIESDKIVQTSLFGATLVGVRGTYDDANRLGILAAENGWGLVNINIRPYYIEGSKTIIFETCEQLGWQAPNRVVIPLGSGALLCAVHRGLQELYTTGILSENSTRLTGSQPIGCAPIVNGYKTGEVAPIEVPQTIVKSLAIGNPASGALAISKIRETNGTADAPTDEEILQAETLLAKKEGIFAEPAGATTLATVIRLIDAGEIDKDETVVCLVTGSGFKALKTANKLITRPKIIDPTPFELQKVIEEIKPKEVVTYA
ncbi:MAG: threonine synthase [Candidatus Sifarchaeia archaeon]